MDFQLNQANVVLYHTVTQKKKKGRQYTEAASTINAMQLRNTVPLSLIHYSVTVSIVRLYIRSSGCNKIQQQESEQEIQHFSVIQK